MLSPVYWHPSVYRWVMEKSLGRGRRERLFRALSERIGTKEDVLDLCCGDCYLSEFVPSERYCGMDSNKRFVSRARARGLNVSLSDLRNDPLPSRDVLVMTAALYYFMGDLKGLIQKMQQAAIHKILILEPVQDSWAKSKFKILQFLGAWFSNVGQGPVFDRFSRDSLERCLTENGFGAFQWIHGHLLAEWRRPQAEPALKKILP